MADILNPDSAILNLDILDSAILVFLFQTHSHLPRLVSTICTKRNSLPLLSPPFAKKDFTHSFWLNLMMPAILNSAMLDSDTAILDSDTLLSSLRFTQKHSHSTLTLTETNSIWLKLIHSHLTWWWQPSWIESWICHLGFSSLKFTAHLDSRLVLVHSDSLDDSASWILPTLCHLGFGHSALWLKLIQSDSNLFIFTQLDEGSHLEF